MSEQEIEALAHRMAWRYKHYDAQACAPTYSFTLRILLDFLRALKREEALQEARAKVAASGAPSLAEWAHKFKDAPDCVDVCGKVKA